MKKMILKIEGMTCSACSSGLEKYLLKQKGIKSATVNLILSIATIEYENLTKKQLEMFIKNAGFKSTGEFKGIEEVENKKKGKIEFILIGIYILFLMLVSMGQMINFKVPFLNQEHPLFLGTFLCFSASLFLFYGKDILMSGIKNLMHKMPNMDTLVMVSILVSFFYSIYGYIQIILGNSMYMHHLYFESVCMVIYFIKLGRFIEEKSKAKTKDAIRNLVQITPKFATIIENGKEKNVSLDEIKMNDLLICKSGEKIAVDGIVCKGKTYVDESFITGESLPVLKEKGSQVIAGSICYDGYIEYKAKRIGRDSTISEIVKRVVEATNSKNKMQKLADKISGYFVPTVLLLAGITFIVQVILGFKVENAMIHAITVLVVACPCALGLAVPLAVVVSNGLCAKNGLFLRKSEVFERGRKIDTIVFDKTGTLTYGKLKIFKVYNYGALKEQELLNIVANMESMSLHPISTAFEIRKKLEVTAFETLTGLGITGKVNNKKYYLGNEKLLEKLNIKKDYTDDVYLKEQGCSIIFVIEEKKIIGLIGVRDIVRLETKELIEKCKEKNIEVVMLTGDNESTAKKIAKELGIKNVIANVLPNNKALEIQKLMKNGRKVMMVGDGINDAPALATASVGVSVHDGTDIAMDAADVILMNNNMHHVFDFIAISKRVYRVMKQNLFFAFIYNICMLPIAMGLFEKQGISLTPMMGSIAMMCSSLTVVLNSLRFGRVKK